VNADKWLAQVVGRNGREIAQLLFASSLSETSNATLIKPDPNGSTVCTQTPRTWIASRHIVSSVISADSGRPVLATRTKRS
jgi:hypothetical protein